MLSIELLLLGVIPDSLSTTSILSCEIPIDRFWLKNIVIVYFASCFVLNKCCNSAEIFLGLIIECFWIAILNVSLYSAFENINPFTLNLQ
jgi:hypothetical protein